MDNSFWNSIFGTKVSSVDYCESASNNIIAKPGYFISDFAYILVGLYLITRPGKLSKIFGLLSILVGTFSGIYDASHRFNAQLFDLSAMFLFICFLLMINLRLLNVVKTQSQAMFLSILLGLAYLIPITLIEASSGRFLFGILVVGVVGTEYLLVKRGNIKIKKYFLIALTLFLVGFGIWLFDATQSWCSPSEYLNGRGIYHYLTAITIYLLYLHNNPKLKKANLIE